MLMLIILMTAVQKDYYIIIVRGEKNIMISSLNKNTNIYLLINVKN